MNKTLSIIIPVYNKEKYLHTCMQSLIDLDIDKKSIEVICVDDLSTDNSLEIINQYAKAHDFIKVTALENNSGGPSRPRNIGMAQANGTYLTLLDADDWLDSAGLPKLLHQMLENHADIGFGQSYKHTNKAITKIARFASYKNADNLVPYEIEKIFRAVGPPGKIFKKSIIQEHNIEFEHMKFGEDKLFFVELISKCKNASMTTTPVYHVNRQSDNVSLIKETTILDKAAINMEILKKILMLDIPEFAKNEAVTRIVEVDLIRRYFHTKTFLKSFEKDKFYQLFDEFERVFSENDLDIEDYIKMDRFKNIYYLYKNADRKDLTEYIEYLVNDRKKSQYIKDGVMHSRLPSKYSNLIPITEELYPVYGGTHLLNGKFYEVIQVYKRPQVKIDHVYISKIADETVEQSVEYKLEHDKIYIHTEDLNFEGVDINLRIIFDDYKSALVYSTPPNASEKYLQNRQGFKAEFKEVEDSALVPNEDYITVLPESIVALKDINSYYDEDFKNEKSESIEAGRRITVTEVTKSTNGTPRLKTEEGSIITANKKFVKPLNRSQTEGYITEKTEKVRIIKKCKMYHSRAFNTEPIKILERGDELFVSDIVYTNGLTPRLKIRDSYFITANMDYVEAVR